jgi:hypothetical protein
LAHILRGSAQRAAKRAAAEQRQREAERRRRERDEQRVREAQQLRRAGYIKAPKGVATRKLPAKTLARRVSRAKRVHATEPKLQSALERASTKQEQLRRLAAYSDNLHRAYSGEAEQGGAKFENVKEVFDALPLAERLKYMTEAERRYREYDDAGRPSGGLKKYLPQDFFMAYHSPIVVTAEAPR